MAANVYLTDVLSSVSSINSAVREVVWGLVQVIACKTSLDNNGNNDEKDERCDGDMDAMHGQHEEEDMRNEEELAVEMLSKDLPLSFGNPKSKCKKKRKIVNTTNKTESMLSSNNVEKKTIRLPRSKHHIFLEQNIMMGYYNEDGNWYPCRVLGNGHIGIYVLIIKLLLYGYISMLILIIIT